MVAGIFTIAYVMLGQQPSQEIPTSKELQIPSCIAEGAPLVGSSTCCGNLTEISSSYLINGNCMDSIKKIFCTNCGNGICENRESVCNCPEDCSPTEEPTENPRALITNQYIQVTEEYVLQILESITGPGFETTQLTQTETGWYACALVASKETCCDIPEKYGPGQALSCTTHTI